MIRFRIPTRPGQWTLICVLFLSLGASPSVFAVATDEVPQNSSPVQPANQVDELKAQPQASPVPPIGKASPSQPKPFSFSLSTGLGYDANVYLAPRNGYFDPLFGFTESPTVRSGFFTPVLGTLRLTLPSEPGKELFLSYSFRGHFYWAPSNSNANAYNQRLNMNWRFPLESDDSLAAHWGFGLFGRNHYEVFVDHNTGQPGMTPSGSDISTLRDFFSFGANAWWSWKKPGFFLRAQPQVEYFIYQKPAGISPLDHLTASLEGRMGFRADRKVFWTLNYKFSYLNYFYWLSTQSNGIIFSADSPANYVSNRLGTSWVYKPMKNWLLDLAYDFTLNTDTYAGYNDYTQHQVTLKSLFGNRKDATLLLKGFFRSRQYAQALVFNTVGYPVEQFQRWEASLRGEKALGLSWRLWVEIHYATNNTVDPRYNYWDYFGSLGLHWSM